MIDERYSHLSRQLQVLLVEDDDPFRALLRSIFEHENWRVLEATNGRQAVQCLKSRIQPDVIVTDLNMPELDGIGLIEALPSIHGLENTIVVVCTALDLKPQDQSRIAGRAHLLIKKSQLSPSGLASEVRQIAGAVASIRELEPRL